MKQMLFGLLKKDEGSCPSASSSTNTTPDSSVPCTPLDEIPPEYAHLIRWDDEPDSHPDCKHTMDKKGSLGKVVRRLSASLRNASIKKVRLYVPQQGTLLTISQRALEDVREIFQKGFKKNSAANAADDSPIDDYSDIQPAPVLPEACITNESTTSLDAVLGSPVEERDCFPSTTIESSVSEPGLPLSVILSQHTPLDILKKIALFLPYTIIIGLAPLMFPTHLSALAFSPVFGYAPRPRTPFHTFAHHVRMLPYHFGIACGVLGLLAIWSVACGLASAAVVLAGTWWAWRDFSLTGPEAGQELGVADRMSIYWLIKGVVFGDMVCPRRDFDTICRDLDEVCRAVDEEDNEAARDQVEDTNSGEGDSEEEGDFEMLQEPDGSIDCTIQVAGAGNGEPGTELRIIVECVG